MRWLRRFFYSDDPVVKVAGGLSEPEAKMFRELLENDGVVALAKGTSFLSGAYGFSFANDYDLWVKQSDEDRAREVLAPVIQENQLVDDGP